MIPSLIWVTEIHAPCALVLSHSRTHCGWRDPMKYEAQRARVLPESSPTPAFPPLAAHQGKKKKKRTNHPPTIGRMLHNMISINLKKDYASDQFISYVEILTAEVKDLSQPAPFNPWDFGGRLWGFIRIQRMSTEGGGGFGCWVMNWIHVNGPMAWDRAYERMFSMHGWIGYKVYSICMCVCCAKNNLYPKGIIHNPCEVKLDLRYSDSADFECSRILMHMF